MAAGRLHRNIRHSMLDDDTQTWPQITPTRRTVRTICIATNKRPRREQAAAAINAI